VEEEREALTLRSALKVSPEVDAVLGAYAEHTGKVSRAYFRARHVQREGLSKLKRDFPAKYGLTGRQFNGVRFRVDGQVAGAREAHLLHCTQTEERLERARKSLAALEARMGSKRDKARRLHELGRRVERLEQKLEDLEALRVVPPLCFGSRKLFRAQFSLEANGYADHAAWREGWQKARGSHIHLVGSHDESAGNQSCQITLDENGRGTAHLRLPDALVPKGAPKVLALPVEFKYGAELLRWATGGHHVRDEEGRRRRIGNAPVTIQIFRTRKVSKKTGRAKGPWKWSLHVSFPPPAVEIVTDARNGALGADLNSDMIALSHVDASGNVVRSWQMPVRTTDRSEAQVKAALQEAAKEIVAYAREHRIPVVMEDLDFTRKKQQMKEESVRYRRMLSGFAYSAAKTALHARGRKEGVEVKEVDPAYSSTVGEVKFAEGYGLSGHMAAAVVLARRGMNLKQGERLRARSGRRASGDATPAPVRMRSVPVREQWKKVHGARQAARKKEAERQRKERLLLEPSDARSASANRGGGAARRGVISGAPSGHARKPGPDTSSHPGRDSPAPPTSTVRVGTMEQGSMF
jgi:IS605 OrfB family transposase